jgi:hypothetical protein
MIKVSIEFMLAPRGNLKEWGEDGGSGGLAVAACIITTITRQQTEEELRAPLTPAVVY